MDSRSRQEQSFLSNWKTKLALLSAIVIPTATATGSFYKLQLNLAEKQSVTDKRISDVELSAERNFADKHTMDKMRDDVSKIHEDVSEIKTLLKNRL